VWARLQREPEALAVIRLRETALDGLRLALPLAVNGAPVGLLLLGRRDPDDVYAPDEVEAIRALANQTAIALAHIVQTGRLRAFFQANIDRHEEERTELARELHDDILNELGRLRSGALGADADATYGRVIGSVRGMISGLRPAALSFGLQVALEQLADDLSARGPLPVTARFTGAADGWRYDPLVEQHLYRIAQQAAENALKHAAPTRVVIEAELHAEQATLAVIDDGRGLPPGLATDLDALLEHRHFGLAGMHERAALIGAHVRIDPHPPQGTRVQVTWLRT
jgi:signal transduction histidine kinase